MVMLGQAMLISCSSHAVDVIRGAPHPDPDPARYPVNLVDPPRIRPDPMYLYQVWIRPDLRKDPANTDRIHIYNYDIKHHSIFSFQEMTHDNTELYTKTR